ncbi:cytochrome c1 [Idiomarina tyrosinivorans]|uniref:Cytochrome c1 n=1 Tax=Idiomarina tyrosinivorans TaxID=1445662 RepID=A0A432ZQI4_9GAMM|nr:cytochrome c1 [Idiomarina tyrosinivorans]RUO80098.1 cytochrome c1 [Idiomarina tyrosinivorans]
MRQFLLALLAVIPALAFASESDIPLDEAKVDLHNKASLQRGAQLFMNYCLGCHSLKYQRYNQTFEDLGIPEELGQKYLQFTGHKKGDLITNNMPAEEAGKWFGNPPPDLTNVIRVRGKDWVYTYLRSFYVDDSRPWGVNNVVFPNVGMPHVLQELQGVPTKAYEERMVDGEMKDVYVGLKSDGSGRLSPSEYDQATLDITNFLVYMAEPMKLEQRRIGWYVFGFLLVFTILAWLLKKEFWKDLK